MPEWQEHYIDYKKLKKCIKKAKARYSKEKLLLRLSTSTSSPSSSPSINRETEPLLEPSREFENQLWKGA